MRGPREEAMSTVKEVAVRVVQPTVLYSVLVPTDVKIDIVAHCQMTLHCCQVLGLHCCHAGSSGTQTLFIKSILARDTPRTMHGACALHMLLDTIKCRLSNHPF